MGVGVADEFGECCVWWYARCGLPRAKLIICSGLGTFFSQTQAAGRKVNMKGV